MDKSKSLFFQLFRRSKYGRAISLFAGEDTQEAERQHRERERFAATSVAFCIEHDDRFRELFWKRICCLEGERLPRTGLTVEVEPEHWADLRLMAQGPKGRIVWAIECKTGATLHPKQDPTKEEFFRPNSGYGWLFDHSESNERTDLRYVVLGAGESLCLPRWRQLERRVLAQQRAWTCLQNSGEQSSLVSDLFRSLGLLGISDFYMDQAKRAKVASFGDIANAIKIVTMLGSQNGFNWNVTADARDADWFYLGAFLKRTKNESKLSPPHRRLLRVLRPSERYTAFFGYELRPDRPERFKRTVYLYTPTRKRAVMLAGEFKDGGYSAEEGRDGETDCVVFSGKLPLEYDLEWFQSIIDFASKL
jgi:hypothetical protein